MTKQEKQLLLIDLSARLPYGVFVEYEYSDGVKRVAKFHGNCLYLMMMGKLQWKDFKPYLRPMSSMTEEEAKDIDNIFSKWRKDGYPYGCTMMFQEDIDYLNAHHFDYRGLIPMGLALEAPEGMYK